MTLGIPLIAGLTPGQRAHVVAHELGHFSNGDSSRGFVQSAALRYLYNWYAALDDAASYGLAGLLVVPLKWPLAGAILLKQRLIAEGRLLGEHRADLAGARWTSADSAVQALARINGAVETYERLVSSWVRRRDHAPEPMQDVASALAAVPQSEQRRWLRVVELDRHIGVGDLHPSNASRVEVIRALTAPGVIGDVHGWGRIDAELAAPAREMAMALRRGSSMG